MFVQQNPCPQAPFKTAMRPFISMTSSTRKTRGVAVSLMLQTCFRIAGISLTKMTQILDFKIRCLPVPTEYSFLFLPPLPDPQGSRTLRYLLSFSCQVWSGNQEQGKGSHWPFIQFLCSLSICHRDLQVASGQLFCLSLGNGRWAPRLSNSVIPASKPQRRFPDPIWYLLHELGPSPRICMHWQGGG